MYLLCFNANISVSTKIPERDVISYCGKFGWVGWHNIFNWKLLQSDVFILLDQILLTSLIFYTYLANIVFWCNLAVKLCSVILSMIFNYLLSASASVLLCKC